MKSYPVFILLTVDFFGLVLVWIAMACLAGFIHHNEVVACQATKGVRDIIARFIENDLICPVTNPPRHRLLSKYNLFKTTTPPNGGVVTLPNS